ncbi:DNA (cytosine-5-)-methyltransferase [Leptotrichia hofstadii]|uniref:Cytosine-specific methyltransferase n=1 Tax=Leptotrichia hofstadii TaxID=157688 RepID=A0A510JJX3_9FUSO|nr:DNA (cytosine-5-)-methyltransferase [Leptotrichia hofstadii]BBM38133.1 DNA (cytosine-5-)-methyltransferase [Leptotrichia hofstadii]
MKTISLFCGAGGLDLGFKNVGFDIVWANDSDKFAVESYKKNVGEHVVLGDITEIDLNSIPLTEVIIGGFPCQPFSIMGSELGFEDTRGTLFFRILEIIRNQKQRGNLPKVIVLENVKRLLTHDKGNTFKIIKKSLEGLGYNIFYKVLNSADYGIPQIRNRVFIVCFLDKEINFEFPKEVKLDKTMQDLLEKNVDEKYFLSEKIIPTILSSGTKNYKAKTEIDLKIARPLCSTMHKMHRASQDNYITDNGRIRRLTPREAARLQGFPENFEIIVSDTQAYRQFGNAVTVTVAEKVALSIKEAIDV